MTDASASRRRWLVWTLRALVLLLVCIGVRGTVSGALDDLSKHSWQARPGWLILSGVLYVLGLVPMAWFWHRVLAALGQPAPWPAALRGYFLGHLGKYVPGKAMSVILRVTSVMKWVTSIRIALISTLLETLTMMAVGAFLAAALSITVLRLDFYLAVMAGAMAFVAGLPTIPPIARRLARFRMERAKQESELTVPPSTPADIAASLHGISVRLLVAGWLAAGACWVLLALSLWATLRAIGIETILPLRDLPLLVAAVTFAVVAGFLSLLPGGLGVRDAVLMQLLAHACGDANALVAAVLLRLVWLVSEVIACGILYLATRWKNLGKRSEHPEASTE